ncbi:MAG: bifunctional 5,10-methylene-tetrahydrofolate dehydrogenase/5,10-methylene-tetrahydrofolate cyclohydrolase, partial [Synergistaceae bacterium]|nr:bifunctional 5,10-methylene-tetrahydrofolate dehydrogenase/5,10-methylene-tetrahydrofolate cyclohydrolase [Synergistaceae bacterium]
MTNSSLVGVFTGSGTGYPPCTAQACVELLDYYGINVAGKNAAVIGRSLVIGR